MKIRFADSRPSGDFALVLPVSGKNRIALDSLGADRSAVDAALKSQRFEGIPEARPSCSFPPTVAFGA
ncbi:hypothetical protein H9L14_05560 [Sphingomonas sediminicola]|uniref:Uncharacterized protein n=1 Tax=Sphingomonas sediminicola TaxID=386874 RepID=A0ABX6TB38_9SPHN|nr:hypothetical protein [Sphingomonas sediminicola]QNP46591.1 hypothetical protein H9L14_05560 [Sphingomonas sediminicola]